MVLKHLCLICLMLSMMGCQALAFLYGKKANTISVVGIASISEQTGNTLEERQLRAMKASKMEAYKELSEQVHGVHVRGETYVHDQRLEKDDVQGKVGGLIRAAEVVSSYQVGDTYVTELKLDLLKMERFQRYTQSFYVPIDETIVF